MANEKLDEVGNWTEIKLAILRDYSKAYAQILSKQSVINHYAYIDGFAGAGVHISKASGKEIEGSPAIALGLYPGFSHYHFIDLNSKRVARLRELAGARKDVSVYDGDCNSTLLNEVFPKCRYDQFRRALCLLDPYGLNPNWQVIQTAGKMKSIEIFLNFMIMDANMNVLWNNPDKVEKVQIKRMDAFWGDNSWRSAAYKVEQGLFGDIASKTSNDSVISAYQKRLRDVAGFKYVPDPIPMLNTKGAVIYYLFFASNNPTGDRIARAVFKKFRKK